jgi:hypothetical protein
MIVKHNLTLSIAVAVLLFNLYPISAQTRKKSLQLKISGINFSLYESIQNHAEFGAAISFPVANRMTFRHEIGYFQYKHYWNSRSLEYRGTTYTSRNGQLLRNYSLIPAIFVHPYKRFYLGTGMGIDIIYVKRIVYTGWRSFWVDQNDNVIEVWKEKYDKTKICIAGSIIAGWEQPIYRAFSVFIEGKYKIVFAGDDLTDTNDSNVRIFSIFLGSSITF